MRVMRWGDGTKFGDPNTRLGSPSYVLEPGDPGYVPPISPTNQPPKRSKHMKRNPFWPVRVADQVTLLVKFSNKLSTYAATLGLTPAQSSTAIADALWLVYVLQSWLPAVRSFSLQATDAATDAATGDGSAVQVLPPFDVPALPSGGTPVNTGALTRLFAVFQAIKSSPGFTDLIGDALGLLGTTQSGPDYATLAPTLKLTVIPTGVNVGWGFAGFAAFLDMIELQVDRNDGKGYVLLAYDTTPGYLDTCPRPATLTKWKYKGIYRVNDQQVGNWSPEVSVSVGG